MSVRLDKSARLAFLAGALRAFASLAALGASAAVAPAYAQGTPARIAFNIPAGPLDQALRQFSDAAGVQLVYSTPLVAGLSSPGVQGSFTVQDAMAKLLSGTQLVFRMSDAHTVAILPASGGRVHALGPVEVEGVQTAGPNGSTDPTATEGTGSYTTSAMTVGSKTPQSIKDTPQSVSVVTRQQIQDQNLVTTTDALNSATGITLVQTNPTQVNFYARGFAINNLQIDGGAPLQLAGGGYYRTTPDLAEYDHVEILRGSDALFGGYGQPSAVINLERKRPLDHDQFIAQGQVGSWDNERVELDATGPIGWDDKLRGRIVAVYQDRDYFYQVAHQAKTLLYAVTEADLPWNILVRFGGSYERQDDIPFIEGLPRYSNGNDLRLPRSTFLGANWNRWNFQTPELFAEFEHPFSDQWKLNASATRLAQNSNEKYGYVIGAVNPITDAGTTFRGPGAYTFSTTQYSLDAHLTGSFQLFGRAQDLVLGADYSTMPFGSTAATTSASKAINIFTFSPSSFDPEPATPAILQRIHSPGIDEKGLYGSSRLSPIQDFSIVAGFRLSGYSLNETTATGTSTTVFRYQENNILTPYGGITYSLSDVYSLYASYADIYQSQANELTASGQILPPVTGETYEVGAKGSWNDGALNGSIALYRVVENNLSISDPNVPVSVGPTSISCCYLPGGTKLSQGVDFDFSGQILPFWQVSVGYTYDHNNYESGFGNVNGQVLASSTPKHLLKIWTTYRLPDDLNKWTVGGGVIAQSSNFVSSSACMTFNTNGTCAVTALAYHVTQGAYAIVSASIGYRLDEHWSAGLNVNNVLDTTYYQTVNVTGAGNWYGDPRNFMFTLRYMN